MGHNIVLSGLKALNGQLEFFNVDEFEVLAAAEHFMATGAACCALIWVFWFDVGGAGRSRALHGHGCGLLCFDLGVLV
jgi:hypothetical protein